MTPHDSKPPHKTPKERNLHERATSLTDEEEREELIAQKIAELERAEQEYKTNPGMKIALDRRTAPIKKKTNITIGIALGAIPLLTAGLFYVFQASRDGQDAKIQASATALEVKALSEKTAVIEVRNEVQTKAILKVLEDLSDTTKDLNKSVTSLQVAMEKKR